LFASVILENEKESIPLIFDRCFQSQPLQNIKGIIFYTSIYV